MNIACINSNLVIIYDRTVLDDFSAEAIENIIKNTYIDDSPEVGTTTFPNELSAVFSPSHQLQVVGQGKNISVGYTKINETDEIDTDFVRLAYKVFSKFKDSPLQDKMHGYNHIFAITADDVQEVERKIRSKYFKAEFLDDPIEIALPQVSVRDGRRLITYKYDLERGEANEPKRIIVNVNIHFEDSITGEVDDFTSEYAESFTYINQQINEIFED